MKFNIATSAFLLFAAPVATAGSLKGVEEDGRELQDAPGNCRDVFRDLRNVCEEATCDCGVNPPTNAPVFTPTLPTQAPFFFPDRPTLAPVPTLTGCNTKRFKMVEFATNGVDPAVTSDNPTQDPPIEVRFSIDNIRHYPANVLQCGQRSLGLVSWQGENYCQLFFGASMDTSDAVPLIRDDNDGTISFRFFESDNTPLEYQMFMNLFPNEWYSETCSTYYVTVYVPYFDSFRRVKCYEFGEGILDIGIDRCRVNNLPQSDFYKFKFEVSSVF